MTAKTLFYSWQSDLDPDGHNYLIRDALKKALKIINKEIDFELSLDKDTQKTSGSPDIVDTIFRKIRVADIFVADVTIINPDYNGRKTPNPNVLIELGYAIKALGWERIICVVNTDTCRPEDLPFDIRNNRTSTYGVAKAGIKAAEKSLTDTMVTAIRAIVDDYDGILKRFRQDDFMDHDKGVFEKFNKIASQVAIFESLEFLGAHLRTNDHYYRLWDHIDDFYKALEDHFLNPEIQASFEVFAKLLAILKLFAATKLFGEQIPGQKYAVDYEIAGVEITPEIQFEIDQTQRYRYPAEPSDNDWNSYHKRLYETQDEFNRQGAAIMAAYKEFRLTVKKHIFI